MRNINIRIVLEFMYRNVSIDFAWGKDCVYGVAMVSIKAYATVQLKSDSLGLANILPGSFNTASVLQDPTNINAGIIRINFATAFLNPPVVFIQPVRIGINWLSPGLNPFIPDGSNVHRDVFPLPPSKVVGGTADEIMDIPVARVDPSVWYPVHGGADQSRALSLSSRIEIENKMLASRLLAVERDYLLIQFASFLGQVIRVRPFNIDGSGAGSDDYQQGTINEILFGYIAAGDLTS